MGFVPSYSQVGPLAEKFTGRGVVNVLPPGSAPTLGSMPGHPCSESPHTKFVNMKNRVCVVCVCVCVCVCVGREKGGELGESEII